MDRVGESNGSTMSISLVLKHSSPSLRSAEKIPLFFSGRELVDHIMRNIQNITFPRSGHHLIERCIESLFLEEFHYCDYYRHCRQIPCSDPKTTFQKNHDFKLSLSQDKRFHYLVQYRNPLQAIASWYIAEHKHRHKNRDWRRKAEKEGQIISNPGFICILAYIPREELNILAQVHR